MNCKQGDLAIVIRGPDAGAVVRCLKYVGETFFRGRVTGGDSVFWMEGSDDWLVECDNAPPGTEASYAPDSILRPLRADPETQETDKPVEVEA